MHLLVFNVKQNILAICINLYPWASIGAMHVILLNVKKDLRATGIIRSRAGGRAGTPDGAPGWGCELVSTTVFKSDRAIWAQLGGGGGAQGFMYATRM